MQPHARAGAEKPRGQPHLVTSEPHVSAGRGLAQCDVRAERALGELRVARRFGPQGGPGRGVSAGPVQGAPLAYRPQALLAGRRLFTAHQ